MTTNADYERLRTAIITGELGPNTRLIETDVCDAYGMSRGAVRNALIRLEQEGLVVREPNRGARVRQVSDQEASEILQARAVLEGLVARQAAETIDLAGRARLQEILDRHGSAVEAGDLLGASDANAQLHAAILEISGNTTFARLITALNSQTVRYQFRTILTPGRPGESHQEHAAIVAAITSGDADEAERAMRHHLFSVVEVVRRLTPAARANGAPVVI